MRKHLKVINLGGICIYFECVWVRGEGDKTFDLPYSKILALSCCWVSGKGERGQENSKEGQSVFINNCKTFRVGRTRTLTH